MISVDLKWSHMISDDRKWSQMTVDYLRSSQMISMISNDLRWIQLVSDGFRWFQLVTDDFSLSQLVSDYFSLWSPRPLSEDPKQLGSIWSQLILLKNHLNPACHLCFVFEESCYLYWWDDWAVLWLLCLWLKLLIM